MSVPRSVEPSGIKRTLRSFPRPRYLLASIGVAVMAIVIWVLVAVPTPYQVLLPGPAIDVQTLVQPNPKPLRGALYLTTIYSDPASVGYFLYAKVNPQAGIEPREAARPKGVNDAEYNRLLRSMMDESKTVAQVVAFRAAGYDVKITGQGAEVQDIAADSKAIGVLQTGDVIVAADGQPISTANDLVALTQNHRPGDTLHVRLKRGAQDLEVDIPLGESPSEPGRARAGIVILTHLYQYDLPKHIDLPTHDIGGPSAGLMFALGVYNVLTPEDLLHGHKIAGTGTITTDGKVGAVGGVKYKIYAAEKVGAELFLVPRENYDDAKQAARHMRVEAVSSFDDALGVLKALPPTG